MRSRRRHWLIGSALGVCALFDRSVMPRRDGILAAFDVESNPFTDHVGAHSHLKLHQIAPIVLPPRFQRHAVHDDGHGGGNPTGEARPLSHAQGHHNHNRRQQRPRIGSFAVTNSSIFSSPLKRASQSGTISLHRNSNRIGSGSAHQVAAQERARLARAESIAFDPFSDSPCYKWLIQDPTSSSVAHQCRRDPFNLQEFRAWMTSEFPKVVRSMKSLEMLHDRPPPPSKPPSVTHTDPVSPLPLANAASERTHSRSRDREEVDSDDSAEEDPEEEAERDIADDTRQQRRQWFVRRREAKYQAWGMLFEHARIVSVPPGDVFVTQDETPARDIVFVLSGHCQLLFQPKFLDLLVRKRNDMKKNNAKEPGPHHSRDGAIGGIDAGELHNQVDALLAMRRLSLSTLTTDEAYDAMSNAVYPLRVVSSGEYFGLEACAFRFPHHAMSAVSQGALQRNSIGIATQACLHVLVVPFHAIQSMRETISRSDETPDQASRAKQSTVSMESLLSPRRRAHIAPTMDTKRRGPVPLEASPAPTPPPGCQFREEDVEFLRHTFVLQSMQLKRLQFLATQLRLIHVPRHEYLFTTGQEVLVYLVKSGQLRVFSPEHVRTHTSDEDTRSLRDAAIASGLTLHGGEAVDVPLTTVETRNVELEILQLHDLVGLMEASLLQPTFSNYCLATSVDVWVYVIPPVALFSVLSHEATASHQIVENLVHHHSWYKARKFTALNHHNTQTEFRLSLGAQQKSPIPCSRCGWSGHTSTSSICVRATSYKTAFIEHLMGKEQLRPAAAPVPQSPVRTRADRVSQLRLMQTSRTGSVVVQPASSSSTTPTIGSGQRSGSMVFGGGGGGGPSNGSMLPRLDDLAALIAYSGLGKSEPAEEALEKSAVVKALDRLHAALDVDVANGDSTSAMTPVRPKTQQQHRRPGDAYQSQRGSLFNLHDEALRAAARIGTAAAAAASSPRAKRNNQEY